MTGTSGTLIHSTTVTVTVPTVSSAPQNLVATAGNNQVSLTWNPPASDGGSPITGYDVYRNGTEIAPNITSTSYTDTGLTNGDTDTYQVTAVNAVGQSQPSNSASATPAATQTLNVVVTTDKPSYPQGSQAHITVTVTGPAPISGASITLTVTNPSGGTSQGTGTTNSNGQVTFTYHVLKHAQTGTYTASANAIKSGYSPGSGSTTFNVT
ncbi:MAG: fibronectin type III domain-containing protein [Candidatus Nitrosotalea sp.]|nr:fibronectin type III domain-containing protein [Candidatus Nitrosotalea sp.]